MRAWEGRTGDPARLHDDGRKARYAVETARSQVAERLGVRPRDVIFTASGTEGLNWAIYAACGALPSSGDPWGRRVIASITEHTAVLDAARIATKARGLDLDLISVNSDGVVDEFDVPDDTAIVAVSHVNHETGVIQPIDAIARKCREAGVRLLVDACASIGIAIPSADLVVVSGHKLGGPEGAAAIGLGNRVRLPPLFVGGEQELLRRAGGENVAGAIGLGAAMSCEIPDVSPLRDRLCEGLGTLEGVTVVGLGANRGAHIVCITVDGVSGEALLLGLDSAGISANSGSSCSAERLEPSHVLIAMGAAADSSLRFSFGAGSDQTDVDAILTALPPLIDELRNRAGTSL